MTYNNMMIVVTASCHDEYRTQVRLESPDLYVPTIDEDNPLQSVADYFEDKGITIDQGGDDNTIEFDLPDSFDNAGQAQRTAAKVMKRLQTKLKKYMFVPPAVSTNVAPCGPRPTNDKPCCSLATEEEYRRYFQGLLASSQITQEYFDVCMQPDIVKAFIDRK